MALSAVIHQLPTMPTSQSILHQYIIHNITLLRLAQSTFTGRSFTRIAKVSNPCQSNSLKLTWLYWTPNPVRNKTLRHGNTASNSPKVGKLRYTILEVIGNACSIQQLPTMPTPQNHMKPIHQTIVYLFPGRSFVPHHPYLHQFPIESSKLTDLYWTLSLIRDTQNHKRVISSTSRTSHSPGTLAVFALASTAHLPAIPPTTSTSKLPTTNFEKSTPRGDAESQSLRLQEAGGEHPLWNVGASGGDDFGHGEDERECGQCLRI